MYNKIRMMNEALSNVDSRYRLTVIVFKRARLLAAGDEPLVKSRYAKPVTIALEEFAKDYLEFRAPGQENWSE